MSNTKFAYVLKRRREEAGMSQLALARLTGICNKRISAFEKGRRFPTAEEHSRLSLVLGSLPPALSFEVPPWNEEWRERFRDRREWQPEPERSLASRLSTAREAWPEMMARWEPVVREHEAWLSAAPFGSALELLVCLLLLEAGAMELCVRLLAWGFRRLPVVDARTGEGRGEFPAARRRSPFPAARRRSPFPAGRRRS